MNKPVMKQEVKVFVAITVARMIVFYATDDAVTEFDSFGMIRKYDNERNKYSLYVDYRYEFSEVLAYIQNYGKVEK